MSRSPLLPIRHKNRDFFIPDIFDNLSFKDDIASMEHPFFSLSVKPDLRDIEYTYNGANIKIQPNSNGLPTVLDKDILLYCTSLIINEYNTKNIFPPKTIRVSCRDFLIATNRTINGNSYSLLKRALERLKGVTITTNIETNSQKQSSGFSLIDQYRIVESSRVKDRMVRLEITLSDWFYNSILGKEILTINRDYFRLRKPLERRLYELARKHCGSNTSWKIGLDKLQLKTGSTATQRKFRYYINKAIETQHIPDYKLSMQDDVVIFHNANKKTDLETTYLQHYDTSLIDILKEDTYNRTKTMARDANLNWHNLIREFLEYTNKNNPEIKSIDGMFMGFVMKKTGKSSKSLF